jgi:hypothetical protein
MDNVMLIWEEIQKTLDEMAKLFPDKPWALRCYLYSHRKLTGRFPRRNAWEDSITEGLADRLSDKGLCTKPFRRYAHSHGSCDLVIRLNNGEKFWIECKTAYRMDLGDVLDGTKPKELCGDMSWVRGVRDIAAAIEKLGRLRLPVAHYLGVLLIGFDRDQKGERIETDDDTDDSYLYKLLPGELRGDGWVPAHGKHNPHGVTCPDRCSGRAEIGYRDRLWFWYRRVAI